MLSVRRMTAFVLVMMILGSFLTPAVMLAGESETRQSGDFTYYVGTESTAVITRYTGEAVSMSVPGTLDGYAVVGIGDEAFASSKSLIEVTLLEGLESIGDRSFQGCLNLETVTLPDTVVSIGEEAFSYCYSLTDISLPEGLTSIKFGTFRQCDSLPSIMLSDGMKSIGSEAFHSCDSLAFIVLPRELKVIGEEAFSSCRNLRDLTLPENLLSIGESAFASCSGLNALDLSAGLKIIGDKAFAVCLGLTRLTLPEGLKYLGTQAFYANNKLNSVALPPSLSFIGSKCFDGCPDLTLTIGEGSYAETWAMENAIPYMAAAGERASTTPEGEFWGGKGSKENPVLLSNVSDLFVLQARVNGGDSCEGIHFRLTQDIVLNEGLDLDIEWIPLKTFNGTLDGDGHAVTGMYVTWRSSSGTGSGFIGQLNGLVKNLTVSGRIETPQGSMEEYRALAGGICAKNYGTIENCASYVTFYDNNMFSTGFFGGICGDSQHGTVMNCIDNSRLYLSPKYWDKHAEDSTRDLSAEKYIGISTFSLDEDPVFHRDYLVRNNCVDISRYMGIAVPATWNHFRPEHSFETQLNQTAGLDSLSNDSLLNQNYTIELRKIAGEATWPPISGNIAFGHYEQDNDTANGKEMVDWRVLAVEGDQTLVISGKNLDCMPFSQTSERVTWETSTLRAWLNNEFYNTAFSTEEKEAVLSTSVSNQGKNEESNTLDRIFLLSLEEVRQLFKNDFDRLTDNTAYTIAKRPYYDDWGNSHWWLRSQDKETGSYDMVMEHGSLGWHSSATGNNVVRPALWLNTIKLRAILEAQSLPESAKGLPGNWVGTLNVHDKQLNAALRFDEQGSGSLELVLDDVAQGFSTTLYDGAVTFRIDSIELSLYDQEGRQIAANKWLPWLPKEKYASYFYTLKPDVLTLTLTGALEPEAATEPDGQIPSSD